MSMQDASRYAVGLDIGSTHVRCVIGMVDGTAGPTIVGVGTAPNSGMRKGVVVNIVNTAHAIDQALEEAERMSGHQIDTAAASINGVHITALSSKGVIAVNSPNHEITEDDVARVQEAATVVQLPANREILQVTPRSYMLDGHENIKDPLGMSGVRLEVDAHVITALTPNIKNVLKSLEMAHLQPTRVIVAGLAAAKAVVTAKQMENGVAIVDFGATTTSVIVFEENDLQHVGIIPMGSVHITNDLAIGLRTDLDIAEEVKLQHASAMAKGGKDQPKEVVHKHGADSLSFNPKDIDMIVGARLDEIFELIDQELSSIDRSGKLPGGVVITGGGASLANLAMYAKEKLRLPVRIAKFEGLGGMSDSVALPEYATALGLMLTDLEAAPSHSVQKRAANSAGKDQIVSKLFKSASDLIKKFKT